MARAMARAPKAAALAALLAVTGLTAGGPAHAATPMTDLRCTVRSSPANGRLNTSLRRCTKLKCKIVCAAKGYVRASCVNERTCRCRDKILPLS